MLLLDTVPVRVFDHGNLGVDQMARRASRSGKKWTAGEVRQLRNLAAGNTPTRLIAHKLGRTEDGVYSKAADEGVSLKPTNQAPYGTQK